MEEVKTYGVYVHSSGASGGYVVRTRYNDWCPSPYCGLTPVAVYKTEKAAQRKADSLNA